MEAPWWFFVPTFYGMFILPVVVPAAAMTYMSKRHHWNRFWLAGAGIWLTCTGLPVAYIFSQLTY